MNQQDLRVIKTKKNIEESFLRLLEKKSFSEITVQNILDEALINRSTFYKHYSDKYDLARLLSDRMFQEFQDMLENRFLASQNREVYETIDVIYEVLYDKREIFLNLWKIHTDEVQLENEMADYLKHRFISAYSSGFIGNASQMDYLSGTYAALTMSSLKWCLNHDYDTVREVVPPFVRNILLAMQEFRQLEHKCKEHGEKL